MADELIEIRLTGNEILPSNVRAGDIADILIAVESMIESVVARDNPGLEKESVLVGLVNISAGSVRLQFSSQSPETVLPAYEEIADALSTDNYRGIPSSSINSLQKLSEYSRKQKCKIEFIARNGNERKLTEITPETEIKRTPLLKGETVLYGQIIRVGGRTPKAMLETIDGKTIFCDVDRDIARKLGNKLYLSVALYGLAQWDSETLLIEKFSIKELRDYESRPITESISQLANLTRKYYADVTDVDEYIAAIRGVEGDS